MAEELPNPMVLIRDALFLLGKHERSTIFYGRYIEYVYAPKCKFPFLSKMA